MIISSPSRKNARLLVDLGRIHEAVELERDGRRFGIGRGRRRIGRRLGSDKRFGYPIRSGGGSFTFATATGSLPISNSERAPASTFTSCSFASKFKCSVGSMVEGSMPVNLKLGLNSREFWLFCATLTPERATGRPPAPAIACWAELCGSRRR